MQTLNSTPADDGYRMPAEFELHRRCWMLWPERPDNWRENAVPAQAAFAAVAAAIGRFEPVTVGASAAQYANARRQLPDSVQVIELASNDAWMRDVGPTFVVHPSGVVRGVDWRFNAWGGLNGGLYAPWDLDEGVAGKVLQAAGCDRYAAPLIMEGGAIHVDGQGTLITTEECLLNPNRNPDLSRAEIETYLRQYLGIKAVIWLGEGVYNDETNGHVDNLCCFVRPGVVVLTWTDDPQDPQYAISSDAYERLSRARDAQGRPLQMVKIPAPTPVIVTETEAEGVQALDGSRARYTGERLAASYVNFYIANGGVVMPAFGDSNDEVAAQVIAGLFPDREVVSVPSREILLGGGNIHCITQQQPR